MRKSTQAGNKQQDRQKLDARLIKASEEDFRATNLALCEVLFKGKDVVTKEDIFEIQEKFRTDLWHYQFHSLEPNEQGRISTENFLKSNLQAFTGHSLNRFLKQIKRVTKEFDEKDPGVSLEEFVAFQHFFDQLNVLKQKTLKYRFLDFENYV